MNKVSTVKSLIRFLAVSSILSLAKLSLWSEFSRRWLVFTKKTRTLQTISENFQGDGYFFTKKTRTLLTISLKILTIKLTLPNLEYLKLPGTELSSSFWTLYSLTN